MVVEVLRCWGILAWPVKPSKVTVGVEAQHGTGAELARACPVWTCFGLANPLLHGPPARTPLGWSR